MKRENNMNESEYQALIETSWRRPLTVEELAALDRWLAAHPGRQQDWELEESLNDNLARLPDAPLASNFTSQVMLAIRIEAKAAERKPGLLETFKHWLQVPASRLAWALSLIAVGWFGLYQHQSGVRDDLAKGIAVMANVTAISDPTALEDFDAIERTSTGDDEELYAVLMAK